MAFDAVRLVGQKRAGLAMAITGYLVSIPVFSDAAFVILTPLVKAIHKKTRISLAILAVSLSAGLLSTHVFVPRHQVRWQQPDFWESILGAQSCMVHLVRSL